MAMIITWLLGSFGWQFVKYLGSAGFQLMGQHYRQKVVENFRDYILSLSYGDVIWDVLKPFIQDITKVSVSGSQKKAAKQPPAPAQAPPPPPPEPQKKQEKKGWFSW